VPPNATAKSRRAIQVACSGGFGRPGSTHARLRRIRPGSPACIDSAPQPPRLIISFEGVSFLSSAALGKLIMVNRRIKERGGELKLCTLAPTTLEVFRVAHLDDYFHIDRDLDTAVGPHTAS